MEANEKRERPRLVKRHVAQGEEAQQALTVADASCEGVVDGVLVDFRHPALPPGEWEARPWLYVGGADDHHCGLLFPSEAAALDRGEWRERDEGDELIQMKLALPRAAPGDKLTVDGVVDRISDRRFDHRHDATVKLAHLALTRAGGEVVRPASPMAFYGVTQLRDAPERDAYDRLADRILAEHGNPDPHKFEIERGLNWPFCVKADLSLSERAGLAIERAERAWLDLVTDHLKDDPAGQAALRSAINQTAIAAFFQAKHELRQAEKFGAATKRNLAKGPDKLRNQNWHDYATGHWKADPARKRTSIFKEMVVDGVAHEDERRAVLRSLKAHPLCPS